MTKFYKDMTLDEKLAYGSKKSRPIQFSELCLMLARFEIMLKEEPDRYTIEEFVQQEDFRRDLFPL